MFGRGFDSPQLHGKGKTILFSLFFVPSPKEFHLLVLLIFFDTPLSLCFFRSRSCSLLVPFFSFVHFTPLVTFVPLVSLVPFVYLVPLFVPFTSFAPPFPLFRGCPVFFFPCPVCGFPTTMAHFRFPVFCLSCLVPVCRFRSLFFSCLL